jgi:hypothetical protein
LPLQAEESAPRAPRTQIAVQPWQEDTLDNSVTIKRLRDDAVPSRILSVCAAIRAKNTSGDGTPPSSTSK